MIERLKVTIQKEFIQFFRDTSLILIVLYMFVEVAICGWALTMDYKNVPIAVMDQDQTEKSKQFVNQFVQSDKFQVSEYPANEGELADLLDRGIAKMGVVIPTGFSDSLIRGERVDVQLVADGENATLASQVLGNSFEVIGKYSTELLKDKTGYRNVLFG